MNTTERESIDQIVHKHDVVLFMKGSPEFPQCGFSATATGILDHHGVSYHSIDVLTDEALRQNVKSYSNWPTIPQLYIKGEFVGGCDILREMHESGEIPSLLEKTGLTSKK